MFSRSLKQPATNWFFGAFKKRLLFARIGIEIVQALRCRGKIQSELEPAFANGQCARTEAILRLKRIRAVGDGFGNGHLARLDSLMHLVPMAATAERRRGFDSGYGE